MAQDLQTTEQEVAEIYISTFGRAPDQAGLAYWVGEVMKGNLSVAQVSESFFDQEETQSLYGNAGNVDFLISIYKNALGQDVDANDEGLQYWLGELEGDGGVTRDGFIKTLINGAKASTGNPEDALLLQNRVDAGLLYAKEVGVNSDLASQIIGNITADAATAESAMGLVDFYKGWVDTYSTALAPDAAISEVDLWANINDQAFWADLGNQETLNFDAPPAVNFWEEADSFWAAPPADGTATPVDPLAFLQGEGVWQDPANFTNFQNGAFRDVDPAVMFAQYSAQTGEMYSELINSNEMDAELMDNLFGSMDETLYNDIFDDMFGDVGENYFADVYSQDGALQEDDFSSVDPFMFNQMFGDALNDDAQFQELFGNFQPEFIAGIYMDDEGKPVGEIPEGFNKDNFPDGFIEGFEGGEFSDDFLNSNFDGQFPAGVVFPIDGEFPENDIIDGEFPENDPIIDTELPEDGLGEHEGEFPEDGLEEGNIPLNDPLVDVTIPANDPLAVEPPPNDPIIVEPVVILSPVYTALDYFIA